MRKAIPVLGTLLFIVFIITSSCGVPHVRPGFGSYKGYHYRKHYKPMKPTFTSPRRVKVKRN
jgi:hypothetical protein